MSFSKKTKQSALWALSTSYVGIVISFIGNLFLARILFPVDFGTFGLVVSAFTFLSMLTAFGSQEAIIQCRDETLDDFITTAFWMGLFVAITVTLLGTIVGILLIPNYGISTGIMFLALALSSPIHSLANSHSAILQRGMSYKPVALIRTISVIFAFLVGIVSAWLDWGAWALLLRQLTEFILFWILIKQASKYSLSFRFNMQSARWIWNFGWRNMLSQMSETLASKYDSLVVGFFLGETRLGHYSQAYRLALLGQQFTEGAVAPILFPMFAILQASTDKLLYAFERVSYWLLRAVPLTGLITIIFGKDIVILVYGERWAEAGVYFQTLFVFIMLLPVSAMLKNFLIGVGQISDAMKVKVFQLVIIVIGASLGALAGSINIVIWSVNISQILGVLLMANAVMKRIQPDLKALVLVPSVVFLTIWFISTVVNIKSYNVLELFSWILLIAFLYATSIVVLDYSALRHELGILWKMRKA